MPPKKRVLIVDDAPDVRVWIRIALETSDCEVVGESENGLQAVERALDLRPDVVIMDVKMPVMDGIEATRCIKERCPDAEIVAFSSTDDPGDMRAIFEAGASAHYGKRDLDLIIEAISPQA